MQVPIPYCRSDFNEQWQSGQDYTPSAAAYFDVPATNFVNGVYQIPTNNVPAFGANLFYSQASDAAGGRGGINPDFDVVFNVNWSPIPYLAGSTQIQQNVSFLLRMATLDQPFSLELSDVLYPANTNYVFAGYDSIFYGYAALQRNEFQPFEENYFYRNFLFDATQLDGTGDFLTGVSGQLPALSVSAPAFLFPTYSYVVHSNQAPVPGVLSASAAQWIFGGSADLGNLSEIGLATNGTPNQAVVASSFHNLFGLSLQSVKYPQTSGTSGTFATAHPGESNFSVTNTTPAPLMIPLGQPFLLTAWAKQSISNGYSGKFAFAEQYFDKAFKTDTNGSITTNETGILSEYGEFFPTDPGKVILTTKPDGATGSTGTCAIYVIKMQLDVNHDGVMDTTFAGPDNTSADRPFKFWINNYYDRSGSDVNTTVHDSDYDVIGSQRDLEDFARLWIAGVPSLASSNGYAVSLSWQNASGNPSIKIFQAFENNGGTNYLFDVTTADNQVAGYGNSLGAVSPTNGVSLPYDFFLSGGTKHLLFEGVSVGTGELVLTISQNGTNIGSTSAFIDLKDVKDMFEHVVVTNITDATPAAYNSGYLEANHVDVDPTEDNKIIVFVHGWRMGNWDYKSFSETMFKRLYWQAYRGRFVYVRWPTPFPKDDYVLPFLDLFTYNRSEFRAFKSGQAVSDYLNALKQRFPAYSLNVASHSMGGIVMMEALKRDLGLGRTNVDNYVVMQGAVPAQCYDTNYPYLPSLVQKEQESSGSIDTYFGYPGTINQAVRNRIIDFYNTNDFALATGSYPIIGSVSWEGNQLTFKPDFALGYSTDGTNGYKSSAVVSDKRELMPFVALPLSKAVGASPSVSGVVYETGQNDSESPLWIRY